MAKTKGPSGQVLKAIRSGLAKLKKAGLFSGDVRGAKGGWRQKSLLKRFADVVQGKAKTVKVGKDASKFDASFRPRMGRVTVAAAPGEIVRYNRKSMTLTSKQDRYGVKFKKIMTRNRVLTLFDLPTAPEGKKYFYKLKNNPLRDYQGMKEEFAKYHNTKGFGEAIEIFEVDADQFPA